MPFLLHLAMGILMYVQAIFLARSHFGHTVRPLLLLPLCLFSTFQATAMMVFEYYAGNGLLTNPVFVMAVALAFAALALGNAKRSPARQAFAITIAALIFAGTLSIVGAFGRALSGADFAGISLR